MIAVGGEDVANFLAPCRALVINIDGAFEEVTVLQIEGIEVFRNGHFLRLKVRRHLTEHYDRCIGILISHAVTGEVTVTLLTPKNKKGGIIHQQIRAGPEITAIIIQRHALLFE